MSTRALMLRAAAALVALTLGCGGRVVEAEPDLSRADGGVDGSAEAAAPDVLSSEDAALRWDGAMFDGGALPPGGAPPDPPSTFAMGFYDVCAWSLGGGMRCSGGNEWGELGDGTTISQTTPTAVVDLVNVRGGARGTRHTCAISGSDLFCWGISNYALGDATATRITRPQKALSDVRQVSATGDVTCAVRDDGSVWCWGGTDHHVLGYDDYFRYPRPVPGIAGALSVVTSGGHACARFADGTAKCWGANTAGQCGSGTESEWVRPTTVVGLSSVVEIGVGFWMSCARTADARVWCWGGNSYNALGEKEYINRPYPAPVPGLSGVQQIAIGAHFGCALLADRSVKCWGDDSFGQLGDGGEAYASSTGPTPRAVIGLTDVVEIAAGVGSACARRSDGSAWCWGRNEHGGLGDGTKTARTVPVPVPW